MKLKFGNEEEKSNDKLKQNNITCLAMATCQQSSWSSTDFSLGKPEYIAVSQHSNCKYDKKGWLEKKKKHRSNLCHFNLRHN